MVFSVAKAAQFTKECLGMASTVQEMQNKFDVVFKGMTDDVENWAEQFANSIGRNKNSIKGYLADNQNLFVGMGMARDRAADLSKQLVEGALDIASFNNVQEDIAINAMSKALMGESEAAKTLGAVLNDNTRAMAMNELGIKGKYQALDEATKMEVNYRAIMMQSKDAIGDCVRSMDSYEARQRQLSAAVQYFKEFVGTSLLPVFSVFLGMITKGINFLTDLAKKIIGATEEENRILKLFERIQAIVKKLQPAIDRMMQTLSNGAQKGINFIKGIVDMLGGAENALKLLSLVAGALFVVLKAGAILDFLKNFKTLATVITKIFSTGTLKVMAMVAIIVILALIVEDFINFLLGNDSVIGTIFDKAGIGADNVRKKIFAAWKFITTFLTNTWNTIKTLCKIFVDAVSSFFDKHGEQIFSIFKNVWDSISSMLMAVFNALYEIGSATFNALSAVINLIFSGIKAYWNAWGDETLAFFSAVFSGIGDVINFVIDVFVLFMGAIEKVANVLGNVGSTVNSVTNYLKEHETAVQLLGVAIGTITALILAYNAANIAAAIASGAQTAAIMAMYAADGLAAIGKGALIAVTTLWSTVAGVATAVTSALGAAIAFLTSPIGIVIVVIGALIAIGILLYKNWDTVKNFLVNCWNTIVSSITSGVNSAKEKLSNFCNGVREVFSNIVNAIKEKVISIKNTVVNGFNAAIDFIKGLPSKAITWGTDFMNGLVKGIKAGVSKVTNAVKGVGEKIKSFLHFSVPDEGPLTDYESWMPDFMEGLAKGIDSNKDKVIKSVSQLANEMSVLGKAAQANPRTVAASQISNRTTNVTQTVDISNSYSGGTPETQRNVSKAMKKSAYDASTYMARALAYSRG